MAIQSVTKDNLADRATRNQPVTEPKEAVIEKPPEKVEEAEKPKKSIQDRIDELTREKREERALAESEYEGRLTAQARVKQLEGELSKLSQPEVKKDARPDRTKYTAEQAQQYEDDLLSWNRREAKREFGAEQARLQDEERQRQLEVQLRKRTEIARTELADFDEVVGAADRRKEIIPAHVIAAIQESDLGPQLAYHMAKFPDEAADLFAMSPARALLALGKIEMKYAKDEGKKPEPTVIPKPKAQAPMQSISGGDGNIVPDLTKPMSFQDYRKQRLTELRGKR